MPSRLHYSQEEAQVSVPVAWTIGGSDSGGGAGIQADLKTFTQLGIHGCSVITAITAQNTLTVKNTEAASELMVAQQIETLCEDLSPQSLKIGMLHSPAIARAVAAKLEGVSCFRVLDPVLTSTSGNNLAQDGTAQELRGSLLGVVDLVTPNIQEAHALLGKDPEKMAGLSELEADEYLENLARELLQAGAKAVLLKGGHREGAFAQDLYIDGHQQWWHTSDHRTTTDTHGTGCTLSAAIAASVAKGYTLLDSIVIAKSYVNVGLRTTQTVGKGSNPIAHGYDTVRQSDLPWVTKKAAEGRNRPQFPTMEQIGFYPIVDRAEQVRLLVESGAPSVQLRVKDLAGDFLDAEIRHSIAYARDSKTSLFINDHWQQAIEHEAFGVHLGQQDLEEADLIKISDAGLRLGISTHCHHEVARALAMRPSYIAIGPIHETTTKQMEFSPQGLTGFRIWRSVLDLPLVAIGGLFLENAPELIAAGADGIAVVRDIAQAKDLKSRVSHWNQAFTAKGA
jgi:hydroxymethylpyrimidine kinase/phosphomethylpyrimidine kinase/thiamine-phosphate diphosphorylase